MRRIIMSTKNTGFQEEKVLKPASGFGMLFLIVLVMIVSILIPALNASRPVIGPVLWVIGISVSYTHLSWAA